MVKQIEMKRIVIFGGTGGLGKPLSELLQHKFDVISLGSTDINILDSEKLNVFFEENAIDIVLNCTGLNFDSFIHKYDETSAAQIDALIDTNIKGSINILRTCLPGMRTRKYGRIILISSILAEVPVVSTGVYAGCKGFLDSIAKTVALENASKGITCNTIQLGYFDAGLTYRIPKEFRDTIEQSIPFKRFGKIEELLRVIEMLIDVEYITGTSLKLNGGLDF